MECKACGAWFSSGQAQELCPTCERALDRLKGYAVPVVRCKDCKHYGNEYRHPYGGECEWHGSLVDPDDFCSYGERRADHV